MRDYMVAANTRALPTTFIVGKTGLVEWIGNPKEVAEVLQRVVDDRWDRIGFAKMFVGHQRVYAEYQRVAALVAQDKREQAIKLIEELIPLADARMKKNLQALQAQIKKATEK